MSEELIANDDQSHYEISLTAGQAFLAFVLLLLSLAASFAFGLMIGKGQADERLVVRKEPAVIQEGAAASKKVAEGRIVDLGVAADDFKAPASGAKPEVTTPAAPDAAATPVVSEDAVPAPAPAAAVTPAAPAAAVIETPKPAPAPAATAPAPAAASASPAYAQLLSTADQKTAETLAAKLINGGFTSAYVERGTSDKGIIFRVRVRFASDAEARAAETKLHEFSKDVWITK